MESYFEENGGTYTQVGDYLIPDLVMDPQPGGRDRYLRAAPEEVF